MKDVKSIKMMFYETQHATAHVSDESASCINRINALHSRLERCENENSESTIKAEFSPNHDSHADFQ